MDTAAFQDIELQIHDYHACPIATGFFALDGGAMFGNVPKILWQKTNPADEKNRIAMEARALLLKGPDRTILIDTGNGFDFVEKYGDKLGGKFAQMYGVQSGGATLLNSLAKFGVTPEDVTDVVLTHLHFDHAGGSTRAQADGKIVPTFPKATYHVQAQNLKNARDANIRERASYLPANFEPLIERGILKTWDEVAGFREILPGVSVVVSHGHTHGQQLVKVSDGQKTIFYCGDLVPTSTHVRLPWIMGYDIDPLTIIEEKKKILGTAARENWYLFFEHDPTCELATIEANGADFQLKERFHLI